MLLSNLIYTAQVHKVKGLSPVYGREKAFDLVVWDFMMATCRHIVIELKMLSWISALYKGPKAKA